MSADSHGVPYCQYLPIGDFRAVAWSEGKVEEERFENLQAKILVSRFGRSTKEADRLPQMASRALQRDAIVQPLKRSTGVCVRAIGAIKTCYKDEEER